MTLNHRARTHRIVGCFRGYSFGMFTAEAYRHDCAAGRQSYFSFNRFKEVHHVRPGTSALVAGGAVIGAGIGLLFAPQTGAETRRDVGRYAKKAQLQATRWGRSVQSGVKEVMDRSKALIQKDEQRPRIEAV